MIKKSLCGLTADEILYLIGPLGYNQTHAFSIASSIYKKKSREISDIPKIPKNLKEELNSKFSSGVFLPVASEISSDKSVKYLFRSGSGLEFEAVYIPDNKRTTVCVSTQSGCRMGCSFCVTARYGFHGNLSAGEIVNQIISIPCAENVTHVVLMGMGEPMDNLDNVLKACEIITAGWGLSLSPRNVTVSTVGIIHGIKRFLQSSDCNLTFSMHSPFPAERRKFVPAEKLHSLETIIELIKSYPVRKKRRLSIAYVMIKDMNDTDDHLEKLKAILKGSRVRINLLPYHKHSDDLNTSSSTERMQYFKHNLILSGISASIRKSRGIDISAACGLLARGLE